MPFRGPVSVYCADVDTTEIDEFQCRLKDSSYPILRCWGPEEKLVSRSKMIELFYDSNETAITLYRNQFKRLYQSF